MNEDKALTSKIFTDAAFLEENAAYSTVRKTNRNSNNKIFKKYSNDNLKPSFMFFIF